eukprot:scaffold5121_cov40-Cyclotella_meneghiniana.AAC.3
MGMETHGITNTFVLLGKALTGTEEGGYQIARHLTDYELVWGGGGGDDLAKIPHLARIANSVYRDHCPGDVTCRAFGFLEFPLQTSLTTLDLVVVTIRSTIYVSFPLYICTESVIFSAPGEYAGTLVKLNGFIEDGEASA